MLHKLKAETAYYLYVGGGSVAAGLAFTASGVYAVRVAGLDPLQLVLVGTVLEVACLLGEVPTGIVADLYSRRLSLLIGLALTGLGFILWGALPIFLPILLAQVVWGIGATFGSGADSAWITDEVGEEKVRPVFMRAAQVGMLCGLAGSLIAVPVASLSIGAPIVAGGVLYLLLAALLALRMPERNFQPGRGEHESTLGAFAATLRSGVREVRTKPVVLTLTLSVLFLGAASEAFDRLREVHFINDIGLPSLAGLDAGGVGWFALIGVGSTLVSLIATEVMRRRLRSNDPRVAARALVAVNSLLFAGTIVFALAGNLAAALAAYWASRLARSLHGPIKGAWLNQGLDSRVRATVISLNGQADAVGQIAGGPAIGALAASAGVGTALAVSAFAVVPAIGLYASTLVAPRAATPLIASLAREEGEAT
jgi:DHA3 family tetracycline resistance protein-like MFS transporter